MGSEPVSGFDIDDSAFVDGPENLIEAQDFTDLIAEIEAHFEKGYLLVSTDDTTFKTLDLALSEGDNISLAVQNAGGNENIQVSAPDALKVTVSANDTTPDELDSKLTGSNGVTVTENNDGGNETLDIALDATSTPTLGGLSIEDASTSEIYLENSSSNGWAMLANTSFFVLATRASGVNTNRFLWSTSVINPQTTGAVNQGSVSLRWNQYFGTVADNISSDSLLKTDMSDIPGAFALELWRATKGKMYRRQFTKPEKREMQTVKRRVTESKFVKVEEWDEAEGAYVTRRRRREVPVFDVYNVKDEDGNIISRKRVPRMEDVQEEVIVSEAVNYDRPFVEFGFDARKMAADLETIAAKHNVDHTKLDMLTQDEDGFYGMVYDQWQAIQQAAMQEMDAKLTALEARVAALENA